MGFSQTTNNSLKPKILKDSITGITYFCFDTKTQSKIIAKKIVQADSCALKLERSEEIIELEKEKNVLKDSINTEQEKKIVLLNEIITNDTKQKANLNEAVVLGQNQTIELKKVNESNLKKLKASKKVNIVLGITTAVAVVVTIIVLLVH